MSKRTSSPSSSLSSEPEKTTIGALGTLKNTQQTRSHHREGSPTASLSSAGATGTPYDTVSIATTANTRFTSGTNATANTSASQQQVAGGNLQQQPHFNAPKTIFKQADTNRDGSVRGEEFRQWAQSGNQTSEQFHYQQAQFANQLPGEQPFNELLGAYAFKDVVLNIDYGVIEAYNVGIQSAVDLTAGPPSGGFDAAKAIFKQVDTNRDGSISRDEFRQWAQAGEQNVGGQSYSSYQESSTTNYGNNFNNAQVYDSANPEIGNILQQSGLGQGYTNYR